jgi:hypothetical protein
MGHSSSKVHERFLFWYIFIYNIAFTLGSFDWEEGTYAAEREMLDGWMNIGEWWESAILFIGRGATIYLLGRAGIDTDKLHAVRRE